MCNLISLQSYFYHICKFDFYYILIFFVLNAFYICEVHLFIFMKFELYKF